MKQLLFAFFLCLFSYFGFAQGDEAFTLSLENNGQPQKTVLPFSAISVIDARFDKSNVGCVVKDLSFKGMTKNKLAAVFPDSLHTYLTRILPDFFALNKTGSDTLIMLIRQFRIADHLSNTLDTYHAPETVLTFSASFYKKEANKLRKISSLNNSWSRVWETNEAEGEDKLTTRRNEAIAAVFSTIFNNLNWTPTTTVFSWAEMENGLQKRIQLPLYTDPVLKTGVYKSFEEFKNNNPSLVRIHLKMKDKELVQILDEDNNPVILKNYWGACDGKNRYVVFRGMLHKLSSSDKSFKFLSYRQETKDRNMLATSVTRVLAFGPAGSQGKPGKRVKPEYFYLNMDNGQIHLEELIGTENYEKAIRTLNNSTY